MKNKVKRVILLLLAVLLLIVVYVVTTAASIIVYSKKDEKHAADAAVILGAATSEGEVSPVYRERINHGIRLYEEGYVKALIMTGGYGKGQSISDAAAAKAYAVEQGIPEEDIFIEEKSTITEENLKYAKAVMEENSFESAIIVSDPLHMKRAMLMAKDYGIEAYSSPTDTSMYSSLKTKIPFLLREEFFYEGYRLYRTFIMPFTK